MPFKRINLDQWTFKSTQNAYLSKLRSFWFKSGCELLRQLKMQYKLTQDAFQLYLKSLATFFSKMKQVNLKPILSWLVYVDGQ